MVEKTGGEDEETVEKVKVCRVEFGKDGRSEGTRIFLTDGKELTGIKFVSLSAELEEPQVYKVIGYVARK